MENNNENQRLMELQQARTADKSAAGKMPLGQALGQTKEALSFGKKISEHWPILGTAAFFDLLAIIPFASVFFNFCFGGVLFYYFGPKRKPGDSELTKIFLPIMAGSVFDFFPLLSFLPVNVGAALIRIAYS